MRMDNVLPEMEGDKGGFVKSSGSAPLLDCVGAISTKPAPGDPPGDRAFLFTDGLEKRELVGG